MRWTIEQGHCFNRCIVLEYLIFPSKNDPRLIVQSIQRKSPWLKQKNKIEKWDRWYLHAFSRFTIIIQIYLKILHAYFLKITTEWQYNWRGNGLKHQVILSSPESTKSMTEAPYKIIWISFIPLIKIIKIVQSQPSRGSITVRQNFFGWIYD